MSELLQATELDEIRQRRERLPICEMVEDNEACRIILAPYASNTSSTATFLREVRDDIPRLLAHVEAQATVVEAAQRWNAAWTAVGAHRETCRVEYFCDECSALNDAANQADDELIKLVEGLSDA